VTKDGLRVQERKIACIRAWPFPKNLSDLRAYIGLCSYYRSYCKGFASIAEPLTECLWKDVRFVWTPKRQEAFDKLKEVLTNALVLAMPRDDPECTWVVDTDASSWAASGVLQQWQDGKLRVVEYASRVFSKSERNYCATRRELAALIFSLKAFRPYLLGRTFEVLTDNHALSFLQKLKNPTGQAARYLDFLSDYDFKLSFRRGTANGNADALSRMPPCSEDNGEPCRQCLKRVMGHHDVNAVTTRARSKQSGEAPVAISDASRSDTADEVSEQVQNHGSSQRRRTWRPSGPQLKVIAPQAWESAALGWTDEVVREAQLKDPGIGPVVSWVENQNRPPWATVEGQSPMLRALWRQFESLCVIDGMLYRSFYDPSGAVMHRQLVLPREFRVPFLELVHHDLARHLKYAKCVPHIIRRAWWHGWKTDLNLFIKCCRKCEAFHRGKPPKQATLTPTYSGAPGEKIAVDLQGPFPASNGSKYILTAICLFSKYAVCVPLRNKEATTVAKALVEHLFLKYGLCHTLLSDLGREFECELLEALSEILGITRLRTSGYRPESNGCCERIHRVLNTMYAKCVRPDQRNWSEWLPFVTFCYNSAEHSATKFPPFFLFTGRMPIWTVDLILPPREEVNKTVPEYATEVTEKLQKAQDLVRENLAMTWEASSKWYNRKARPKSFQIGDPVRVYYPRRYKGRTPKWQSYYCTEGVVHTKLNDATYVVSSKSWRGNKIVHVDKLKPVRQFE